MLFYGAFYGPGLELEGLELEVVFSILFYFKFLSSPFNYYHYITNLSFTMIELSFLLSGSESIVYILMGLGISF